MNHSQRLRIALQKSGRLSDDSFDLLGQCGLHIRTSRDRLFCQVEELPIDILLVRDDDIPGFLVDQVCDLGIVGKNVYEEARLKEDREGNLKVILPLGFSQCRLSLAVAKEFDYQSPQSLHGRRIATSYPAILKDFLTGKGVNAKIIHMHGSVEVAPRLQIADGICDIVSTGATLAANGLKEVTRVMDSQALLVGREGLKGQKPDILARLLSRIQGVIKASKSKYIMLHAPKDRLEGIISVLPGAESPTVLELPNMEDKVAVHAVCDEEVFWETMEELKKQGASAILVLPIEKMLA